MIFIFSNKKSKLLTLKLKFWIPFNQRAAFSKCKFSAIKISMQSSFSSVLRSYLLFSCYFDKGLSQCAEILSEAGVLFFWFYELFIFVVLIKKFKNKNKIVKMCKNQIAPSPSKIIWSHCRLVKMFAHCTSSCIRCKTVEWWLNQEKL